MRFIKLILASIIVLFLLITCIGLLFPKQVTVMRSTDLHAPKDNVYAALSDMKYWDKWLFDSSFHAVKILSPNSLGKNAIAQVENSKITITNTTDSTIESIWQIGKIHSQTSLFVLTNSTSSPGGTEVIWYFHQKLNWYPWERIGAVMNEKILGPSMDSSFARLHRYLNE